MVRTKCTQHKCNFEPFELRVAEIKLYALYTTENEFNEKPEWLKEAYRIRVYPYMIVKYYCHFHF